MSVTFLPNVGRCRDYLSSVSPPPPSGSIGARKEEEEKAAAAGQQALFRSSSSFSFGGGGGENLICCYIKGNFCSSPDGKDGRESITAAGEEKD